MRNQRGFSLIEVMLAAFLLGFSLLGLAKLNSQIVRESELVWQQMQAAQLAQMKLEVLKHHSQSGDFSSIKHGCGAVDSSLQVGNSLQMTNYLQVINELSGSVGGCSLNTDKLFLLEWQVSPVLSNLKTVQLKVSWLNRFNQQYFISLDTQLTP